MAETAAGDLRADLPLDLPQATEEELSTLRDVLQCELLGSDGVPPEDLSVLLDRVLAVVGKGKSAQSVTKGLQEANLGNEVVWGRVEGCLRDFCGESFQTTPVLFDLIGKSDWDGVMRRCAARPEDARWAGGKSRFQDENNQFWEGKILTPLHLAAYRYAPAHVMRALLAANPLADYLGPFPPLHIALHRGPASGSGMLPDCVPLFFARYPSETKLHRILNVPLDVARIILSYCPHPGTIQATNGRTALHYACALSGGRALDIARLLRPEGASVADTIGQTPLYVACAESSDPSIALLRSLIRVNPGALTALTSNNAQAPLHAACATLKPSSVVEVLLEHAPQVASMVNRHGLTPLQLYVSVLSCRASSMGSDLNWYDASAAIQALVEANPDALSAEGPGRQATPAWVLDLLRGDLAAVRERMGSLSL